MNGIVCLRREITGREDASTCKQQFKEVDHPLGIGKMVLSNK